MSVMPEELLGDIKELLFCIIKCMLKICISILKRKKNVDNVRISYYLYTQIFLCFQGPETNLLVIQRGLVLMKNHLESFRKRYAYHLRNWQLDGKGIISHQRSNLDKQSSLIRVQLQPAGIGDKVGY